MIQKSFQLKAREDSRNDPDYFYQDLTLYLTPLDNDSVLRTPRVFRRASNIIATSRCKRRLTFDNLSVKCICQKRKTEDSEDQARVKRIK